MIAFNHPPYVGNELEYVKDAIEQLHISGDGKYTKLCSSWIEKRANVEKCLLTTSCTHALEMAAMLCDINPGDEVIMPSFTFCSTADAFVLRGGKIVFVDIRPDTMNMDETLVESAITEHTKAIIPVHYAGVSCEMDSILQIAKEHNLMVIEDAAQGMLSKYKGKQLGSIGDMGTYSFHETKNYSMGEGGAILLQDKKYIERAEIIREKGTNRSKFFRGEIDKYTWIAAGSSYLPSDMNAAYLYAQLNVADHIFENRMETWNYYYSELKEMANKGQIEIPVIPKECEHNAHIFWIKLRDLEERTKFIQYAKDYGVNVVYHYVPLHSSNAGRKYGRFHLKDTYTTKESERLVRLPLWYGMGKEKEKVIQLIHDFMMKVNLK